MKTPKKCERKTCRSRQALGLMRRGVMQFIIKTQVSCRKGKASQKVWQWLDKQWTRALPRIAQDLQGTQSNDVWNTLQDHWKMYQKKHYARDDNQVEELREPEKECEASDKDDWQIEMPDGD